MGWPSMRFLLTPLREGRRRTCRRPQRCRAISTHAPAGGATSGRTRYVASPSDFYSRPCGRGDTAGRSAPGRFRYFYSRPCGRGDDFLRVNWKTLIYFYSRPCGRGDRAGSTMNFILALFLLTPLREGRRTQMKIYRKLLKPFLLTPLREGRRILHVIHLVSF